MKNINTILILLGILSGAILTVENFVLSVQTLIFLDRGSAGMLVIVSIITGIMLGWGLKGKFSENKQNEEDNFSF